MENPRSHLICGWTDKSQLCLLLSRHRVYWDYKGYSVDCLFILLPIILRTSSRDLRKRTSITRIIGINIVLFREWAVSPHICRSDWVK